MIGRRNEDRIDVLPLQDAVVVLITVGLVAGLPELRHGGIGPRFVDVARRHERGIGVLDPLARHGTPPVATSDDRGADPVVRADGAALLLPGEQRSGARGRGPGNRQVQEITSLHMASFDARVCL